MRDRVYEGLTFAALLLLSQRLPGKRSEIGQVTDQEIDEHLKLARRVFERAFKMGQEEHRAEVIAEGGLFVEKCSACGESHLLEKSQLRRSEFPQDGSKPPPDPFPREYICARAGKPVEVTWK
jgi:hypothetical protein